HGDRARSTRNLASCQGATTRSMTAFYCPPPHRGRGGLMAEKTDFTDEEWEGLQKGVMGAGLLVSLADRRFFDTFKEAGALTKHLKEAREHNPSTLVRDLAEVRHTGFGMRDKPEVVEQE